MTKTCTTEEFIKKARKVHGDKYDYSKVNYVRSTIKVEIICPKHGSFWQTPSAHLSGQGCRKCGNESIGQKLRMTTEEFIEKARKTHGDKYDYSKVNYVKQDVNVEIICPKHGSFFQNPNNHIRGANCPICALEKIPTEEFIEKARKVHGDKYDYSKTVYNGVLNDIEIICHKHGVFIQKAGAHLEGNGCPQCNKEEISKRFTGTTEKFIEKARSVHGDKYDYSKVEYVDRNTPVKIICPKHGEFLQSPTEHYYHGCQLCAYESAANKNRMTKEEFIEKARKVHGDRYDYSLVKYVDRNTPVKIICRKHGMFMQKPCDHLAGCGCKKCKTSKAESVIGNILLRNNIKFEIEKRFDWLRYKQPQRLDFYITDYNIAIEYQGSQHFEKYSFSGSETDQELSEQLDLIQRRDLNKRRLCEEHNIPLYYINYNDDIEIKLFEILDKHNIPHSPLTDT